MNDFFLFTLMRLFNTEQQHSHIDIFAIPEYLLLDRNVLLTYSTCNDNNNTNWFMQYLDSKC